MPSLYDTEKKYIDILASIIGYTRTLDEFQCNFLLRQTLHFVTLCIRLTVMAFSTAIVLSWAVQKALNSIENDPVSTNRSVHRAPGTHAFRLITWVFSKKTVDAVFSQLIADMRAEHAEALHKLRFRKARWIVVRDHFNLLLTVALYVTTSIGKKLVTIWKIIP